MCRVCRKNNGYMCVVPILQPLFLGQFVPLNSGQTSHPLGEKRYSTYTLSLLHSSQRATGTLALWHSGMVVAMWSPWGRV